MPASARTRGHSVSHRPASTTWIPAIAGMTAVNGIDRPSLFVGSVERDFKLTAGACSRNRMWDSQAPLPFPSAILSDTIGCRVSDHGTGAAMQSGVFKIQAQERVVFGTPAADAVIAEADHYGAGRVFVTSTRSLAKLENGPLQRIERALGTRHAGTFTEIASHSPREDVVAAAKTVRESGADIIVAVGGGSVIDATKALLLCHWMAVDSVDQLSTFALGFNREKRSQLDLPADPLRMIAVPTTLSAADFTSRAGVTDTSSGTKLAFGHKLMVPVSVILDPAATLDTPEWLLLGTGMRAVDHACESYCCPIANPASESLSLKGLALLHDALPRIKADPDDMEARMAAQFGMWHAIWPSASGTYNGASHGIGYALGAAFGVPHGHTSCVMLPAVLKWNSEFNAERQKALSVAAGRPEVPAWQVIGELVETLGMPQTLRDVGVTRDAFDDLSERALGYQPVVLNPRPIKTAADVREILEIAY